MCGLSVDVVAAVVVVAAGMTIAVVTLPVAVVVSVISLLIVLAVVSDAILTAVDVTLDCSSVTTELFAVVVTVGGGGNIMGGGGCCCAGGWSCRDGWLSPGGGICGIGLNELGAGMLLTGMEVFTASTSGPDCYKVKIHNYLISTALYNEDM